MAANPAERINKGIRRTSYRISFFVIAAGDFTNIPTGAGVYRAGPLTQYLFPVILKIRNGNFVFRFGHDFKKLRAKYVPFALS
jgi:uncharacterized membrane protein|tara:strand:- start:1583 stop:1831 length:249 start_codon:yes stop_codon:yes gene_type:complete